LGPPRVAVAVSGGRDSTALLHCTQRAAHALGIEVLALHVNHGLMPRADAWHDHVRRQARRWGVPFLCARLETSPARGDSVEAWARRERYRALAALAQGAGCGLVLLAHHRRDQAETWLLQALRGAGQDGLASMPEAAQRLGVTWARPWLDQPREAIEAYVRRHRLTHVEDESNSDQRFARNRLRTQVWPALTSAFPHAEATLAAAAAQAQQAQALAREVADQDLPRLCVGEGLSVPAWLSLPPQRRRNALRAWLSQALAGPGMAALLERLERELPLRRQARWPAEAGELRLYRGVLSAAPRQAVRALPIADGACTPPDLSQPGIHRFPRWHGSLRVEAVVRLGMPAALLRGAVLQPRQGGEHWCLSAHGTSRSLKKQFQAMGVPPWERAGPLVCSAAGCLLFVPGLGMDPRAQAEPGAPRLQLSWVPDVPSSTGPGSARQEGKIP
jgi:tRNA(Ile)-lysidine synthase